jgi:fibronectin type 3 domain-containing protein
VSVNVNAPSAPSDLKATAGTGSVMLTWKSSKGADPIVYNIKRSTKAGAETPYATITVTSYTDTSVVTGKKYCYLVTATNCKAKSGKSNEVSAVPK